MENSQPLTRSQRRRQQRKRAKAHQTAQNDDTKDTEDTVDIKRQRLRQLIQRKKDRRLGKKQEILVPAPVPGELDTEQLRQHQKKMQKLVQKRGRGALLDHIGIKDPQTKKKLAKAMVTGDTDAMNQIMKSVHDPTADPDLDGE